MSFAKIFHLFTTIFIYSTLQEICYLFTRQSQSEQLTQRRTQFPKVNSTSTIIQPPNNVRTHKHTHSRTQIPIYTPSIIELITSVMGKAASKLSKDDLKRLQENTYFDKRELQLWYKGFLRDCPSGQLTEEDFAKIYQQFFPFGDPKDYCHYLLHQFDQDNSNFIDFKEFILAFSITSRGKIEQKVTWSFDFYDYNKTGKLRYNDIVPVISATYKMIGPMAALPPDELTPELRAEKWFTLLGKNKDTDVITLDDFKRLAEIDPLIKGALAEYLDLV